MRAVPCFPAIVWILALTAACAGQTPNVPRDGDSTSPPPADEWQRPDVIHESISVQRRFAGGNEKQEYFLIRHRKPAKPADKHGLVIILPGGPGTADFLPFCANILTRYAIPDDFLVAQLVALQWRPDANRIVCPSQTFPDEQAEFTSEEFIAAVIGDVGKQEPIDERFVFTFGWSSSGHALYSTSTRVPKVRGSVIAMSRFLPDRYVEVDKLKGKAYYLYHSPDDQICPYAESELAVQTLKQQGAEAKLVSYKGGHGWRPHTFYADRIKEGILWLKASQAVYLFSSFRGNGEDGLHLAYSDDGLRWTALKNDRSFLKPEVGGKLMRDPCIIQGPDGLFHMVWTTSWTDQGIGVAHSKDLIEWSPQQFVPVMTHEPKARNCWAPEITWDPDNSQYVIYWATTMEDRFQETAKSADKGWNHRMYCTTTKDFITFTKARLFFEPGFNVIDSTIVHDGDRYVMILKDETRHPPAKNLRKATSPRVTGPWSEASGPFTPNGLWVEGPSCLRVGKYCYVYFDAYANHRYGAMRTKDFKNWEDISDQLSFPKGTRHGTAFAAPARVLKKLMEGE